MGLSASQGRMLLLTARKNDLEFRAQQISQQRLVLSSQLESISNEYEDATSNREMQIKLTNKTQDGSSVTQTVNLCYKALVSGSVSQGLKYGFNASNDAGTEQYSEDYACTAAYRLVNASGYIVVSDVSEIPGYSASGKKNITSYNDSIDIDTQYTLTNNEGTQIGTETTTPEDNDYVVLSSGKVMKYSDAKGRDDICKNNDNGNYLVVDINDTNITNYLKKDDDGNYSSIDTDKCKIQSITSVSQTHDVTFEPLGDNKYLVSDNGKQQTYVVDETLKNSTDSNGGSSGPNYLQDCLRNGLYIIQQGNINTNDKSTIDWSDVSWDCAAPISDQYYEDDDASAKARYDRLQNQIETKDKKLEMELDNIETQRSAVTTETESVQKVMDDNIEATFKTFA